MLAKCREVHLGLISLVLLSVLLLAASGVAVAREYTRDADEMGDPDRGDGPIDPCELIELRGFTPEFDPSTTDLPCTWVSPAGNFTLNFIGVDNDYDREESLWFYVLQWNETPPPLDYLVIGLCDRITRVDIIGGCPRGYTVGVDLETGIYGIKWTGLPAVPNLHLSFLVRGIFEVGQMEFGVKAGLDAHIGNICGLYCVEDECELDVTCPPTIRVSCEQSTDPEFTGEPTITGNCPPFVIDYTDNVVGGNCPYEYMIERTWTVTDASGLVEECLQLIYVYDLTPPTITCGESHGLACNEPVVFDDPVAEDNCDPDPEIRLVTSSIAVGPGPCDTTHARGWIAVDACGNESEPCFQTIVATVDTEAPILWCAADKSVPCNEPWEFDEPNATDNCDPEPVIEVVSTTVEPGASPCEEVHTRCWIARDACLNESQMCCQSVTVIVDTEPPVVTCGPGGRWPCNEPVVYPDPVITDNCDPDPELFAISTTYPGPGPCDQTYEACWWAIDACGNESERCCITIIQTVDEEPPVITYCPPPDTFDCDVDLDALPHAEAEDNCDDDLTVQYSVVQVEGCHPRCEILYLRTWIFIDDCENEARCEQYVLVVDDERPRICCPRHKIIECDEEVVFDEPRATDNCDPDPEIRVVCDFVIPYCGGCQCDDNGGDGDGGCDGQTVSPALVEQIMQLLPDEDDEAPGGLLGCPDGGDDDEDDDDGECVCKYRAVHVRCWRAYDDCGLRSRKCCQFILQKECPVDCGGGDGVVATDGGQDILLDGATPAELRVKSLPNPLTGSTNISFALPVEGRVVIEIFDIQGRKVTTVLDAQRSSGIHSVSWNGKDARGSTVETGVYFCRVELNGRTSVLEKLVKM